MKNRKILAALALMMLAACSGNNQNQNIPQDNADSVSQQSGYNQFPELIFNDVDVQKKAFVSIDDVPKPIASAKKIVIKGDKITFFDGSGNKTESMIDLSSAKEECRSTGYIWHFETVGNQQLAASKMEIEAEYVEAMEARNEDLKKRPVSLAVQDICTIYPKNFDFTNLRRKMLSEYPDDEEYGQMLSYVNRTEDGYDGDDEYDPDGDEENAEEDDLAGLPDTFIDWLNKLPKSPDKPMYHYADPDHGDDEGFRVDEDYFAYPMKNGGYHAIFRHIEVAEGTGGSFWYGGYTFKDGEMHRDDQILPKVDVNDLIDRQKELGHEIEFNALETLFEIRPSDFTCYIISEDTPEIRAELRPLDYEDSDWREVYWDYVKHHDVLPVFVWDGAKFVRK